MTSKQKPSVPKGTRDFSPAEMVRRNYIFDTIKEVFQLHGYLPIETPAMENLSTLLGKYGEEGDKLLYRILNSGDFLAKLPENETILKDSAKLSSFICDRGLRYDLTVPFARYVVQHRNEITFPFRRYQIQPVWRADRPQKGRYREFYQCDADVIGSNSLLNEAELVSIIDKVFHKLNTKVLIKYNNRKVLTGLAEMLGESDKITDITVAIDKLDKIGVEGVNEELAQRGLSGESIQKLQPVIQMKGSNTEKMEFLKTLLGNSGSGLKGIEELQMLEDYLLQYGLSTELEFDLTLARGLNYYTGAIFEVKSKEVEIGSICGGGRYDNLTDIFGLSDVSGVGISFGADRIYDVLNQLDRFPPSVSASAKVMLINFGDSEVKSCLKLLDELRDAGISADLYPENDKMKKQMNYANQLNVPFVLIVGEKELQQQKYTLKNMQTGDQKLVSREELIKELGG